MPKHPQPSKRLTRLQSNLIELKTSIKLFRDLLLEAKELLVVLTMIVFFLLGVITVLTGGP